MDNYQRQLLLEEEMVLDGTARFREKIAKARTTDNESTTPAGMRLLKQGIEPLSLAIEAFFLDAQSGKAGVRQTAYRYVGHLPSDVVAFITIKVVLDSITQRKSLQRTAILIGRALEDEARMTSFEQANPPYFASVMRRIQRSSSYHYKRTVLIHAMQQGLHIEWDQWPQEVLFHVGSKCLDLLVQSTNLVDVKLGGSRGMYYVTVKPETVDWILKENELCESLAPSYLPCLIVPKPWVSPSDGGYYSTLNHRRHLVKSYDRGYQDELHNREMPIVYEAVNRLQATAWQINHKVLPVLQAFWDASLDIAGLPARDDVIPTPCPIGRDRNPDTLNLAEATAFAEWKRATAVIHDENIKGRSKRLQVAKIIGLARRFLYEQAIYFPYSLDFRGRVYAIPMFLNPQGNDVARGLLTFAEGKPIDRPGRRWLAIHGANCYGYDKVSLDDRMVFITERSNEIALIAGDPYENRQWTEADKPFQYLAFCFEWAAMLDCESKGETYTSHLPVQLDGTCNGLQHFSAMLRDSVGGAAVNLIPAAQPQDIYARVADVVKEMLNAYNIRTDSLPPDTGDGDNSSASVVRPDNHRDYSHDTEPLASQWIEVGVNRSLTKRPVMILPYGGTPVAVRKYIEEYVRGLPSHPFGDNLMPATQFMSTLVWDAIGQVVVSAKLAMKFLRDVAQVVSKEDKAIRWVTPAGFLVHQRYNKHGTTIVKSKLLGQIVKSTLLTPTDKLDKRKQSNGISPNFVHSLDAAALMLYVCKAAASDIESFSVIHDSFGTHAADTQASVVALREAFVSMYREDVLARFASEIQTQVTGALPQLPPKGDLDIELVNYSEFFFA